MAYQKLLADSVDQQYGTLQIYLIITGAVIGLSILLSFILHGLPEDVIIKVSPIL